MLDAIQIIAERRIAEAIRRGDLKVEGWKGKPLPEEDLSHVPPDLRMAYKILKNSGYLPPELELRREITHLEDLIRSTEDEHLRLKQMKKLSVLKMKLESSRGKPLSLGDREYQRKVVEKLTLFSAKRRSGL